MEQSFEALTQDILSHPRFQQTRNLIHHGKDNSVFDHSVAVAHTAYALCLHFGLSEADTRSATRAALLHDFFGYDWHDPSYHQYLRRFHGISKLFHMHAFMHGYFAAHRAARVFALQDTELEAIRRHMFPLTKMPTTRIAWIVTLSDKAVASRECTLALGQMIAAACRRLVTQ